MTTETTTTETPKPTNEELAAEFVKNNSVTDIVNRIAHLMRGLENTRSDYDQARQALNNWRTKTTDFVVEHVKDNEIDVDDLKDFADEMGIELTKDIEVTFKIDVKFSGSVPLDFKIEDIDETDFDINIKYSGSHTDAELEEDYSDVEDFEVSE